MPSPLVSEAIAHYDSLLAGAFDPAAWGREYVGELHRHRGAQDPVARWTLRPFMIDEAAYTALLPSLRAVARGFGVAADRLAADPALRRKLAIPDYLEPLIEIDRAHGRLPVAARMDGIPRADGSLAIIEYNSEPQTAPLQYEAERALERMPISAEFARRYRVRKVDLYERMVDALVARNGGRPPTVAVLDRRLWLARNAFAFRPLLYASARGCSVLCVDPGELEYRSGSLRAAGTPVDLVAFVDWSLLINDRRQLAQVVRAISEQAVGVVGGLSRGLLCSYKFVFELLSDPDHRGLFDREIGAAIDLHIPWTRVLRERTTLLDGASIDLVPFVATHRERFVLKPAGGGGGGNVVIGRDAGVDEWSAAIRRGLAQRSTIVQEHAAPERQRFPVMDADGNLDLRELNCELSPYVWNGDDVDGAACRPARDSVISAERGSAFMAATWIVQ